MTKTIIFLGLLIITEAQLIYPDQYEQMKTMKIPMYVYSNGQQQSTVYPVPYEYSTTGPTVYPTSVPETYPLVGYPTPVAGPYVAATNAPATYSTPIPEIYAARQPVAYSSASAPVNIVNSPLGQAKQASRPQPLTQVNNNAVSPQISPLAETLPLDWAYRVNDIISKGVTKLTLDLQNVIYNENVASVTTQRDNIVFSPLNIAGTLAVVHLGSAGITFDEVSKILGLATGVDISTHSELVHQMFGLLMSFIHHKVVESSRTIDFASAIFLQEGYPIRPEFKTITENVYQSEVRNLDFQRRGQEAQNIINAWVKEKTKGKISILLNDVPLPSTNVIIASALYFNAEWDRHFLTGATYRKSFFVEPDQEIQVDMMHNGGDFPFYEDKNIGVKILGLPYKGLDTTMYILLPKAQGARALQEFTSTLTPETIEFLIQNMKNQTCIVGMPRMKLSNSFKLKTVLRNLGLTSLFDPVSADLSLLSPGIGKQSQLSTNAYPSSITSPTNYIRPSKSMGTGNRQSNNRDQLVFSRFGGEEDNRDQAYRRHYFKYFDNVQGYNIEQWATGFSIKKMQRKRRNVEDEVMRVRRQSRPVSEDFLNIIANRDFQSFGLDNLRNSANIINPGLYADEVLHKVEIDINEKGTEAAAASAVILERDGTQKRLIANRPFLFFIRHNPTKLMLFWGMINTPTPNYSNT